MGSNVSKTADHASELSLEEIKAEIADLQEHNQLLKAEISQLEAFQLECDREATHLRNLAELSQDMGIYRLRTSADNPERGRILYMSPAAKRIMNVPDPMDHNSWFEHCHPDDVQIALKCQAEALRSGVFRFDARVYQGEDGSWRWIRFYSFAVPNEKGEKDIFNGFIWDVTAEKQAKQEAEQQGQRLRRLSYQLFQEEERQRQTVAGVLHDKIGQSLSMLRYTLAREAKQAENPATLERCLELLDLVIEETRTLTSEIYPTSLHELGLVETLRWLCSLGPKLMGMSIEFTSDAEHWPLDDEVAIFLYRAASELLTNSIKHSGSDKVSLSLSEGSGELCLLVKDTGKGFSPEHGKLPEGGGFGLFSIREKLTHLDGRLVIESAPDKGAEITVCVPL